MSASVEVSVTPLQPRHLADCAALVARSSLLARYGYGGSSAARDLGAALAAGRATLLGATVDGELVGFAWLVPRGAFDRSAYLRLIVVDRRARKRGVGRALVAALEARHLEPSGIALLCTVDNAPARRFYEGLGYAAVGELRGYVKPGLDELIYFKGPHAAR